MRQDGGMPRVTREATTEDAADVADLLRRLWAAAGPNALGYSGATDTVMEDLAKREAIIERLGGPDRRIFLSGEEDGWLGFAATRRLDQTQCELAGILVTEEATGRGVGRALMAAVAASARRDGFEVLVVRTEVDNERAIAFYRSTGFMDVGRDVEDVDGTHVPVVELRLILEP